MNFRYFFCIIFFVFTFFTSFSQKMTTWSLETCIKYGLEHNIQMQQQILDVQYSENTLFQSRLNYLPTVTAGANHNYNFGRSVDAFTNEFSETTVQSDNFYVNASINLFNGFQQQNTISQNQLSLMAAVKDVEKLKNDISLNIAAAYLQVLYAQDLLDVAKNQHLITLEQVERTKKLVAAGTLPQGTLLEIQAQAASEELQVITAENQFIASQLNLTQMLNLDSVTEISLEKPNLQIPTDTIFPDISQTFQNAQNLPQIKSAEYRVQSAEKRLSITKGMQYPRVSLSASWNTGFSDARKNYSYEINGVQTIGIVEGTQQNVIAPSMKMTQSDYSFADQFSDNQNKSISIGIQIPIFTNGQVRTNISNAKINIENYQLQLQMSKNQLFKEVQQAHSDAIAAFAKYKAAKKTTQANEEAFKYIQNKFDVGLVHSLDYNTAKNRLTKVRIDLLQAQYELIFKKNILNFYNGSPIKL